MSATAHIRAVAGERAAPRVAIVLGSGLGGLADAVQDAVAIPYAGLEGFPEPTVGGHAGRLVLGSLQGVRVAVLQGRAHLYEGVAASALAVPVRTVRALGAHAIVLTNAAGSLRPEAGAGRLMVLTDHINMMGANPLAGPNDDAVGPRFPGLGAVYDAGLRAALHDGARTAGVELAEGVYAAVLGPSFETPAEIRALRVLGADAVGMSTVPEAIAAVHCGLRVAAVSVLTNLAEGLGGEPLTHEGTLAVAATAGDDLRRVLLAALPGLAGDQGAPAAR